MKKLATVLTAVATGITLVQAQTPANYNVSTSTSMTVLVEPANISISTGQQFAQNSVSSQPVLKIPSNLISSTGPFVAIMMDNNIDLMHWLQPNLYSNGSQLVFNATGPNAGPALGAPYLSPSPPAGSSHTYVIALFTQPSVWQIPLYYSQINPPPNTASREGINIATFASAANLGSPIAANYFMVSNGSVSSSSGSSTMTTMTSMTSGTVMSTGTGMQSSSVATSTGSATASASASASAKSAAAPSQSGKDLFQILSGVMLAGLSFVAMW